MSERYLFGEAITGLVLSFIVLFLAPLGIIADAVLSIIVLVFLLVPISKALLNLLFKNKTQTKIAVKYAAGILTILAISIGESFAPLEAGAWVILGTIIYVMFDDIQDYLVKKGWTL